MNEKLTPERILFPVPDRWRKLKKPPKLSGHLRSWFLLKVFTFYKSNNSVGNKYPYSTVGFWRPDVPEKLERWSCFCIGLIVKDFCHRHVTDDIFFIKTFFFPSSYNTCGRLKDFVVNFYPQESVSLGQTNLSQERAHHQLTTFLI